MKPILAVALTVALLFCGRIAASSPSKADLSPNHAGFSMKDDLLGVCFLNPEQAWVCGRRGVILHTEDGGLSWSRQQTGTDCTLVSVFFWDSQSGWAVGDEGTILHTDDGGAVWAQQQSPVPFYLMEVLFVSPRCGWIVTEQTHILHTIDGGRSWQVQFRDRDFILKAISFADPRTGWAVGEYGHIYHTTDGGSTWKQQAGSYRVTEDTGQIDGGYTLFDVTAVDAKTAWAVGLDGQVLRTVDGGATWSRIVTGVPATPLFSVASDRKGTIVIAGKGVLLLSGDGGETWRSPDPDPPINWGWIYGLALSGVRTALGVGWNGSIYRSEGDLKQWRRVFGGR